MTTNAMTPPGISIWQRYRLMQIRNEHGIHYMFSTPHDVLTQKLSFEFATGFLKNSTLTVVAEVEDKKAMEIQYESTKYQNRYLYFRREADETVSVGTKGLVHDVHHRYDIKLNSGTTLKAGVRLIRFVHDSSGNLNVTLDGGKNILAETVSADKLVSCSRIKHGVPYFDQQDSTDLMNFKVYELHHGSPDPTVLFEQISKNKGSGFTLPPFVFVETGGKIVFSGKFHGRALPTNKISVMYGGKEATTVQGAPLDQQAWLVMQFYTTKIAISLADSKTQEPSVISRFRKKDDGTIDPTDKGTVRAITINRNFQVNNVFV
ncbi:hypothetical protein MTO96_041083, partial [Rhipicephalus appendiculatus]